MFWQNVANVNRDRYYSSQRLLQAALRCRSEPAAAADPLAPPADREEVGLVKLLPDLHRARTEILD